jgi:hypothetical protein
MNWSVESGAAEDDESAPMNKHSAIVVSERRLGERATLQLGAGAVIAGEVRYHGTTHDAGPGFIYSAAGSYRLTSAKSSPLFVVATASLAASLMLTKERAEDAAGAEKLFALDGRLGMVLGKRVTDWLSPYAALRVFGLPVFWRYRGSELQGTDAYHYQLGVGLVAQLLAELDLHCEAAAVGERSLSAGIGTSF